MQGQTDGMTCCKGPKSNHGGKCALFDAGEYFQLFEWLQWTLNSQTAEAYYDSPSSSFIYSRWRIYPL